MSEVRAGRTKTGDLFALPILDRLPRLLTQIDRNPHSPTYGSCCRNWWHYRIEDISNAQFQELVLTLVIAWTYPSPRNPYHRCPEVLAWIEAVMSWTCRLQRPSGSFEEVYRGHDSYAATAFVSFCTAEAVLHLGDSLSPSIKARAVEMVTRASVWLAGMREHFAGNQIAGAAAVHAGLWRLTGDAEAPVRMEQALDQLAATQHDEGWFQEYGGADIGYTTLSHSFLVHVHHHAGSERAGTMASRAAAFLRWFLHDDGTVGGLHGSRNTEYCVPFGIVQDAGRCEHARAMWSWLAPALESRRHRIVTDGLDDRYFAYLSPYFMLAATMAPDSVPPPATAQGSRWFPGARLWVHEQAGQKLVVAANKGGILRWDGNGRVVIDSGVFGRTPDGRRFTSQALTPAAPPTQDDCKLTTVAPLRITRPIIVSPWRNLAFRLFNLLMPGGARTLALTVLRKRAVAAGSDVGSVERSIMVDADGVTIEDTVTLETPVAALDFQLGKERTLSFASTGFFQDQELKTGWADSRQFGPLGPGQVITRHRLGPTGVEWADIRNTASRPAFDTLERDIITAGLCTRCGTCVGLCGASNLVFTDPLGECLPSRKDKAACTGCHIRCDAACPGPGIDLPSLAARIFGTAAPDLLLGHARAFHVGWSTTPEVRRQGSSGGVITGLLADLLERGEIDGVACLVDNPENPLQPCPVVARDRATLMQAQQSKYSLAPVNQILAETALLPGRFAIVGLPHQVHALRLLQAARHPSVANITLILGSYCGVEQHFTAVAAFLAKHGIGDLSQVARVEYRAGAWPGALRVTLRDGRTFEIEKFYANYMSLFYPVERSLLCVDLTNELADISFGDAWSTEFEDLREGYSLVVVRSEAGETAVNGAIGSGAIVLQPSDRDKALEMHSHGLYNKKIAVWARMELRRWLGGGVPAWGYTVDRRPKQRMVGLVIAAIFALARTGLARWTLSLLPLDLVGKTFLLIRRRWRRATRPGRHTDMRTLFRVRLTGRPLP